jgi:predicted DNA-binding transcriptional regulator AlpA
MTYQRPWANSPPVPREAPGHRPPLLISVKEVARICGVSPNTVWNRCNPDHRSYMPNHPRPRPVGGRTFWRTSEIEAFVSEIFGEPAEVDQ